MSSQSAKVDLNLMESLERARDSIITKGELPLWMISSESLYQLELRKLWPRTWNFVGHESEIPNPGNYMVRHVGPRDSVIIVRGDDGRLRAFLNQCVHRGRKLSAVDYGETKVFKCPYHGWSYNLQGRCIGVPFIEKFPKDFDPDKYGLIEVRMESYGGLLFVNLDGRAESLRDYLGDYAWYLDIIVKRSKIGLEFHPPIRWVVPTNWKVAAENLNSDGYHIMTTHLSGIQLGMMPPDVNFRGLVTALRVISRKGHSIDFAHWQHDYILKHRELMPACYPKWAPEVIESAKSNLTTRQFETWITYHGRTMFGIIYPNLSILHSFAGIEGLTDYARGIPGVPFIAFRLLRPIRNDLMEWTTWFAVEKDANPRFKQLSYRAYIQETSVGGFFEPDDMDNFQYITESSMSLKANLDGENVRAVYPLRADPVRPLHEIVYDDVEVIPLGITEQGMRYFWARYFDYLLNGD